MDYKINATASKSGLNAIEQVKRSIDSLHDKTITITTVHKNYNATNVNQSQIKNITK
jgi:chemotaxis regulatin CheY-phosphate phosphatase CheZ